VSNSFAPTLPSPPPSGPNYFLPTFFFCFGSMCCFWPPQGRSFLFPSRRPFSKKVSELPLSSQFLPNVILVRTHFFALFSGPLCAAAKKLCSKFFYPPKIVPKACGKRILPTAPPSTISLLPSLPPPLRSGLRGFFSPFFSAALFLYVTLAVGTLPSTRATEDPG